MPVVIVRNYFSLNNYRKHGKHIDLAIMYSFFYSK